MSFTEEKARQKLIQLNNTQQSIQTTSQWCLFHYRYSDDIVQLWLNMFLSPDHSIDQSEQNYKLALFYLCNDLVQFAKKKEAKFKSYLNDFHKIIPQIMENIANDSANAHLKEKYSRVLSVWKERGIYPPEYITELKKILDTGSSASSSTPSSSLKPVSSSKQQAPPRQQVDKPIRHQSSSPVPIISTHPSTVSVNIPKDIAPVVSKYQKLDQLYSSYKTSFVNFNKLAGSVLNQNNNQESAAQLNSLLSSLSSLQGNAKSNNDNNELDINDKSEIELKKLNQTEDLGLQVDSLSKEITQLRSEIAVDLRKLAVELDDWIMLDKGKQTQIRNLINDVKAKKDEINTERESVAVYNYSSTGNDEENMPTYADGDASDSDSERERNSDDDSDANSDSDEDCSSKRKRVASGSEDTDNDEDDENTNILKSRKKNKKSVSFANNTETLVFDKEDTIRPSASPEGNEDVDADVDADADADVDADVDEEVDAALDAVDEATGDDPQLQNQNQDLEALLGMLN